MSRWFPTTNEVLSARDLKLIDHRISRLEAQRVSYLQLACAQDPTEYEWSGVGAAGAWKSEPPPLEVEFRIASEESWAFFAWGYEWIGVSQVFAGTNSLWSPPEFYIDGILQTETDLDYIPWYATKTWLTNDNRRRRAHALRPFDLSVGLHTAALVIPDPFLDIADQTVYARNRYIRGYVQG